MLAADIPLSSFPRKKYGEGLRGGGVMKRASGVLMRAIYFPFPNVPSRKPFLSLPIEDKRPKAATGIGTHTTNKRGSPPLDQLWREILIRMRMPPLLEGVRECIFMAQHQKSLIDFFNR